MRRVMTLVLAALVGIAAGSVGASPYSEQVLGDSPVAYWRLGESSTGATAANLGSAGAAADGTYTAGVGVATPGLITGDADTAITLTGGTTDRMATTNFEKLAGGTGFTVECWTNFATVPTNYLNLVGDRETGGDFNLMLYAGAGGFIRPHVYTSTGFSSIDSVQRLGVGETHHLVSTWDAATGDLKLYIDGQQAEVTVSAGTNPRTGTAANTDNPIYIGRDASTDVPATAVIDEAAIYNRPLSNTEIYGHHLMGTFNSRVTLPLSFWTFDESSTGTGTAYDVIDGNNGTFTSTATRTTGLIGAGAAQFNNTSGDGVNVSNGVGHTNDFSFTSGISVEACFATTWDGTGYDEIFRKDDGNNRILLSFQQAASINGYNSPGLSFGINDGTGYKELDMPFDGLEGRPTLAEIADGNTHHVVATYDSASGSKIIYIDGIPLFSTTVGAGVDMISGGAAAAVIGNVSYGAEPFTGILDEVAIYDTALSAPEIGMHWANVQLGQKYFTPEPTTLLLLGGGLAVLARRRRRR